MYYICHKIFGDKTFGWSNILSRRSKNVIFFFFFDEIKLDKTTSGHLKKKNYGLYQGLQLPGRYSNISRSVVNMKILCDI